MFGLLHLRLLGSTPSSVDRSLAAKYTMRLLILYAFADFEPQHETESNSY